MKRREAIQNMLLVASGIAILPACDFEQVPVYSKIPLEKEQYKLIDYLTRAILPTGDLEVTTQETTVDYILTVLNDCSTQEEIDQYKSGLVLFQQYLKENAGKAFKKLNEEEVYAVLSDLSSSEDSPEDLKYFYGTTRQMTIQHFTSSEFYLTNHTDWEFAPEDIWVAYRFEVIINDTNTR